MCAQFTQNLIRTIMNYMTKMTLHFSIHSIYHLFFLFLLVNTSLAQCPQIVWSDEFSGTSLDQTKWNYQTGDGCAEGICGWGNNELQSYQEANVEVNNGTLKITAREQRVRGKKYTSGRINTKNKGDHTYGRFEALIKLPYGDGLWPAFWMLSTNEPYGGWPQSGEIDIMEFVASNPDEIFGTIHYGDPFPNNQFQGNNIKLASGNFPDAYHEFAIEWEPGEIRWFLDGTLYSTKTIADVSPYNWPFDQDFHLLLNVAVGGNLGGPVNDNMLPATMEVDYVRVYDGFKPYLLGNRVVANQASGETYTLENVAANINVSWTVPTGATIVSGQGTNSIVVDFGTSSGNVSASFDDGCSAQTLDLAVEVELPYIKEFSFENFDDAATAVFSTATGTLTEVSNPAPDALNGSALSGEYIRNSAEQYDVLVYSVSNITDASQYVDKQKKFYVDVYTSAPVGTEILLQLETPDASPSNYPTGRHSRYVATITQQNTWQRLEFSLLDEPDPAASPANVQTMILLFASNTFTGDTYYYDNLDSYVEDNGGGNNQAPTVTITSPSDGSTFTTGNVISIDADASDSDGTVSQVEFFVNGSSVGVDNNAPYSVNWTVTSGNSSITAVATDNESATTTSAAVSVTGQNGGNPTSMHVESITTGTAGAGQGNKYGTAAVTILDDLGNPVANATVTGTFSGTFNEQASATTDANGIANLQTVATAKGNVTVDLCVDNVTHNSLTYDSNANVLTCTNGGARQSVKEQVMVTVFPNPAQDKIVVETAGFTHEVSLQILDITGKLWKTESVLANQIGVDVSNIPSGFYLIRVTDKVEVKTIKFTK